MYPPDGCEALRDGCSDEEGGCSEDGGDAKSAPFDITCRLGFGDWGLGFKLPWREAGPPNHHDDKVVSDQ